jgi:hypothetical protein
MTYFGHLQGEGRRGHTDSLAPVSSHVMRDGDADKDIDSFYDTLDDHTREYSREQRQKREVNVEGLSSHSAQNDLNYFYDHLAQGDRDIINVEKLHEQPKRFLLPKV